MGANASIVLPISHWPPFFFSCQSRALTSCATVYPATWDIASSRAMRLPFLPITITSSTSKSSSDVSADFSSGSPDAIMQLANLLKMTGSCTARTRGEGDASKR